MASTMTQVSQDLTKLYGGITRRNKIIIGTAIAGAIATFTYLIFFANTVDYQPLFTNVEDSDRAQITRTLDERKIPYEVREKNILVDKGKVHELRLEFASQGLPNSDGGGFEIFDKQKLGTSDFVQELNLKRALQGELARTIAQLAKVDSARVHLVMPKKALFKEDQAPPSASVVLKLKGGRKLDPGEVKSISHLVASAVEGLDPKHITVIDQNGNLLSRAMGADEEQMWGSSPIEYKGKMERDLGGRVEDVLSKMVGPGRVAAKVTVDLDFKKEEKTEEIFDPDQVVVRSERQTKENRRNDETTSTGVPGAPSNAAAGPAASGAAQQTSNSERERNLVNYEINKVVKHTTRSASDVKRISLAVVVDGTYEKDGEGEEAKEKYVPRTPEEMERIREMAKRAVGFVAERGDEIEVTNVPFKSAMAEGEEMKRSFLERYDFLPQLIRYGIILLLAIVMVFFLFRPLVEWVIHFQEEERLREIEKQQEDVVKSMEEQLVEVRSTIDTSTQEYRRKLQEVAQQAPDLIAAVLREWIAQEE